jgi:hypothetical protein
MDDPLGVGSGEGIRNLNRKFDRVPYLQGLIADVLLQRLPFQQLHHDEVSSLPLANIEDRADMGVIERRGGARLAQVAVDGLPILRPFFRNELQRNVAMQTGVLGLPDHTHPALADLLDQTVMQHFLTGLDRHPVPPL